MFRTIHASAAAAIYFALAAQRADARAGDAGELRDDLQPVPLVEPHAVLDFTLVNDEAPVFVWSSDLTLTPPVRLSGAKDQHLAPPGATAAAIPLPPAAWTGLATLAGLGAITLSKRMRRMRQFSRSRVK